MGYQWGKSPLGVAGWKARALAAEERATKYAAEVMAADSALGDARTQCNAARRELEQVRRGSLQAVGVMSARAARLRDRSERNAARVRMLAGDLRDAREALDEVGRVRQQWRKVAELRRRLDGRAARVRALAWALDAARRDSGKIRAELAREREANRINVRQLEHALANAQTRTTEALQDAEEARKHSAAAERDAQKMRATILRTSDTLNYYRRHAVRRRDRLRTRAARVEALAAAVRAARAETERVQLLAVEKVAEARIERETTPAAPAPVVWEARARDLEGALRDQQSITETWRREAGDARRAVTMLRGALTTARFNAAHTGSEAVRVLEQTEELDYRDMRKG